jgi:hypothetical protein
MDRVFGNVMAYGDGVYSTFSVENARSLIGSRYGDVILQLKLIGGFDRFLIFDRNLARKYYGDNWQIIDQLKTMVPEDIAEKLYSRYGNCETSYARHAIEYKIRGAVYPWGGCTAVLPYDFSSTIPYAASYDYGKTFKKRQPKIQLIDSMGLLMLNTDSVIHTENTVDLLNTKMQMEI